MGFARDLGAAMTFGLSVTTRHKEAETKYGHRRKQHEGRLNAYNEVQAQIQSALEAMGAHFAAAQEILLSTGALTSDVSSNVVYGWYRPQEEVESVENNPDYARSVSWHQARGRQPRAPAPRRCAAQPATARASAAWSWGLFEALMTASTSYASRYSGSFLVCAGLSDLLA